jgi:hypothetical protein
MSQCKHEKFGGDHHCCECGSSAEVIVDVYRKALKAISTYDEEAIYSAYAMKSMAVTALGES